MFNLKFVGKVVLWLGVASVVLYGCYYWFMVSLWNALAPEGSRINLW